MPDTYQNHTVFSLQEVMRSIQRTLSGRYQSAYWIKAEMNKLNHYAYSGHCYPDLVEKTGGKVVAQLRAVIWKTDFEAINARFLSVLQEPLREGIHILMLAEIQFDPLHGLSLRIRDIDPVFSLGELEREKAETILRLKQEGIWDCNKKLSLPLLPQRIAVISVETSKGYADFRKVMDHNPEGFAFFHYLFPAQLQGEKAVRTIIAQLQRIRQVAAFFDVVVIVRGGGGEVGLSAFNHYELARELALFPLPVLTGIGHATNETIAEMVAYRNAITPTEIATVLIEQFRNFSLAVNRLQERLSLRATQQADAVRNQLARQQQQMHTAAFHLLAGFRQMQEDAAHALAKNSSFFIRENRQTLHREAAAFMRVIPFYFSRTSGTLVSLQQRLSLLDPKNILKRGFSITRLNGSVLYNAASVPGDAVIQTMLAGGELQSRVISKTK